MVDWAYVLVIILSCFLGLFLLLAIVLVAMLIGVTHKIRQVTKSAQNTAEHIEQMVVATSKTVTPLMLFKKLLKKSKENRNVKR